MQIANVGAMVDKQFVTALVLVAACDRQAKRNSGALPVPPSPGVAPLVGTAGESGPAPRR
jgi:hypothetical protein